MLVYRNLPQFLFQYTEIMADLGTVPFRSRLFAGGAESLLQHFLQIFNSAFQLGSPGHDPGDVILEVLKLGPLFEQLRLQQVAPSFRQQLLSIGLLAFHALFDFFLLALIEFVLLFVPQDGSQFFEFIIELGAVVLVGLQLVLEG